MQTTTVFLILIALCVGSFYLGRSRSKALAMRLGGLASLHSLPKHYGLMVAAWAVLPALLVLALWIGFETSALSMLVVGHLPQNIQDMPATDLDLYLNQIQGFARGVIDSAQLDPTQVEAATRYNELSSVSGQLKAALVFLVALVGAALALRKIAPALRARNHVESIIEWILFTCSLLAVLTTLGIVLSVMFEAIRFFQRIPITDFLFGLHWSPQMAIRSDQVATSGSFGFIPL